ncbi:hypothetical protein [Hyphomonas oceanitis]|uniref:hypothetical protein n=1 Tax=Hyphomonas oceanitis TaxID=81033 RepID=UPI0030010E7C
MIANSNEAYNCLEAAWDQIVSECRQVLGSELHYQAMVYHALRTSGGVPVQKIGMNVKQYIQTVASEMFTKLADRKHVDFRQGFEPIPDVVIFGYGVNSDWRRRNFESTLKHMLLAIEIKASERAKSRLGAAEIKTDILKLDAHRQEVRELGSDFIPVMMIIDTAHLESERMTAWSLGQSRELATSLGVEFRYFNLDRVIVDRNESSAL